LTETHLGTPLKFGRQLLVSAVLLLHGPHHGVVANNSTQAEQVTQHVALDLHVQGAVTVQEKKIYVTHYEYAKKKKKKC
jgi:hypothetical protein